MLKREVRIYSNSLCISRNTSVAEARRGSQEPDKYWSKVQTLPHPLHTAPSLWAPWFGHYGALKFPAKMTFNLLRLIMKLDVDFRLLVHFNIEVNIIWFLTQGLGNVHTSGSL